MPVTAKDIARELNLSQPTVSRILNGDSKHRASVETRQRVLETAQQMGYRPNAVAASLRRGRTGIIGLHTSHAYDARNEFFGAVIAGLQHACNARGLDLLLHSLLQGRPPEEMFNRLRDGRIDGLILHAKSSDPLVPLLADAALPVVSVADVHPGMAGVACDDADGMKQLVEHLWSRGHRQFVYLAPEQLLPSVEARREVFEQLLKMRRVPRNNRRIVRIDYEEVGHFFEQWEGERVAVCCWNDRTAYNLLHECAKHGIRVPESLAVAGFDGFLDDKLPSCQLTTVVCPWADVASKALETLASLIEKAEVPSQTLVPVRLHAGDTA